MTTDDGPYAIELVTCKVSFFFFIALPPCACGACGIKKRKNDQRLPIRSVSESTSGWLTRRRGAPRGDGLVQSRVFAGARKMTDA